MKKYSFILISLLALNLTCNAQLYATKWADDTKAVSNTNSYSSNNNSKTIYIEPKKDMRNVGNAKKLVGNILVYTVFLNTYDNNEFTNDEIIEYKNSLKSAENYLTSEAKSEGKNVTFYNTYLGLSNNRYYYDSYSNTFRIEGLLDKYPELTKKSLESKTDGKYDGFVVIFYYNYKNYGRSFAWNSDKETRNDFLECAIVFKNNRKSKLELVIAHEMLHTFGARDLYVKGNDLVYSVGVYNSIMNRTDANNFNELFIDDFAKYSIGWINTWYDWYYKFF